MPPKLHDDVGLSPTTLCGHNRRCQETGVIDVPCVVPTCAAVEVTETLFQTHCLSSSSIKLLKKSSRQLVYKPQTAFQLFSILESLQFATLNQLCNELLGSLVIDVVSLIYDFIQIVGHNLC